MSEIFSILINAVHEDALVVSDIKKGARITNIIINEQGKREELLDVGSGMISRSDFASWYGSRQPSLDSWWPTSTEFRPKASPNSETVPNGTAIGSKTRKPRKPDTEKDALLRVRIAQVVAAGQNINRKSRLDLRPLSAEIHSQRKSQGFSQETVRKILSGMYPAQKRLGIAGLK